MPDPIHPRMRSPLPPERRPRASRPRRERVRRTLPVPSVRSRVLLALILLGGLVVYLRLEKEVVLVVDGQPTAVRTIAGTVGDLLDGEQIALGEHDRVRPPAGSPLREGMRISVDHAKEIRLVLNGSARTVHVIGRTVDDVLEQINLRAGRNAFVRPSRGAAIADGDVIEFRRAVRIRLRVDGETSDLITNAPDVGYLLDSLGVILKRHDQVRPPVHASLADGDVVSVTRVRYDTRSEQTEIPFTTKTRETDRLVRGQRQVKRAGVPGLEEVRFRVRLEDGKPAARQVLSRKRVRNPVSEIVLVGTRDPNTQSGTASWYHRSGMVAAHKTLPKGTQVRVTNLANGRTVTVVIDDRGPFVKDWIIDLSDDAFARLAPLSTGLIRVRLEW